jgi:hypothetical protein
MIMMRKRLDQPAVDALKVFGLIIDEDDERGVNYATVRTDGGEARPLRQASHYHVRREIMFDENHEPFAEACIDPQLAAHIVHCLTTPFIEETHG